MTGNSFNAKIRNQPGLAVIDLTGEINAFAEEGLNAAYLQAEELDPGTVVINFKEVSYINSTGIALIVGLLAKARQAHRRMVVFGLSDHYVEIFQITRLADFMAIYPDEASALAESKA
jgi:anti-anti-sigma factor